MQLLLPLLQRYLQFRMLKRAPSILGGGAASRSGAHTSSTHGSTSSTPAMGVTSAIRDGAAFNLGGLRSKAVFARDSIYWTALDRLTRGKKPLIRCPSLYISTMDMRTTNAGTITTGSVRT